VSGAGFFIILDTINSVLQTMVETVFLQLVVIENATFALFSCSTAEKNSISISPVMK